MNNPLHLSNSELLSAYLDGELLPDSEKQLFERLASSDELRSEMRDFLIMRREIEGSTIYHPPAALGTALLARTGLDAGIGGLFSGALPHVQQSLGLIGATIVSAMIAALVMMNIMPDREAFNSLQAENKLLKSELLKSNQQLAQIAGQMGTPEIHREVNKNLLQDNVRSTEPKRIKISTSQNVEKSPVVKTTTEKSTRHKSTVNTDNPNDKRRLSLKEISALKDFSLNTEDNPFLIQRNIKDVKEQIILPTFAEESQLSEESWMKDISMEVRGFSLVNYPQRYTLPQSEPVFNNMAVGMYYSINDQNIIGVEGGQEEFSQKFFRTQNDTTINYRQSLVLPWAGLSYRYTPDIDILFSEQLRPMAGIMVGASQVGLVTRAILGARVFPESSVSMLIGIESAVLAYQFNNRWFASPKLGITYGVSVKF